MNKNITFADIARQHISFNREDESDQCIVELINSSWMQRLRDIKQTSHASLVYMFSEHSRFGHSIGVAHLTKIILNHLKSSNISDKHRKQFIKYERAIRIASLLHDIGHLAPGSHVAFKVWYPNKKDCHEAIATKIINTDPEISSIISKFTEPKLVSDILSESSNIPKWCWQIISGSGWNADRGNWCIVDSILAGVDYGKYNIHAIIDSLTISNDDSLAFHENRIDAMTHFAISRQSMYRQVFFHRVLLSADQLASKIAKRANDLFKSNSNKLYYDETMEQLLKSEDAQELSLETIFNIRESWWIYHLNRWCTSEDKILSDLASRLRDRRLFKTVIINDTDNIDNLKAKAEDICKDLKFKPEYYLDEVAVKNMQASEIKDDLKVVLEDGKLCTLNKSDAIFESLSKTTSKRWLIMPKEVKERLGRSR